MWIITAKNTYNDKVIWSKNNFMTWEFLVKPKIINGFKHKASVEFIAFWLKLTHRNYVTDIKIEYV